MNSVELILIAMRGFLFFSLTFIFINAYSQSFKGKVVDVSTGEALEYAHIGVVGKNIGGISLRNGEFTINLSAAEKNDVVKISSIGYDSFSVSVGSLDLTTQHTIKLQSKGYELNTVEVSATLKTNKFGNQKEGRTYTGWGDFKSRRGRVRGLLIEGIECPTKVKSFSFRINHNDWDSVAFRLNFLSVENNMPGTSILQQNIYIIPSQKHKWITIDLKDFNIVVCSKVIVALEWVDAWGTLGTYSNLLTISRSKMKGYVFSREPGEEKGLLTEEENGLAMYLEVYGN